jgi:hypothetical protein
MPHAVRLENSTVTSTPKQCCKARGPREQWWQACMQKGDCCAKCRAGSMLAAPVRASCFGSPNHSTISTTTNNPVSDHQAGVKTVPTPIDSCAYYVAGTCPYKAVAYKTPACMQAHVSTVTDLQYWWKKGL